MPIRRPDPSSDHDALVRVIRGVRRRYRLRVLAWGIVSVLAIATVALLVASAGMERFRFGENAVQTIRILAWLALAVSIGWFLVRPLLRRVSDEQVALYVEEHDPALQASLLSAVAQLSDPGSSAVSPVLTRRLVADAVQRTRAHERGAGLELRSFQRAAGVAGAVAVVALLAFGAGPEFLRYGSKLVLLPWRIADAATPYRIDVQPGTVTVPRGGAQRIAASLRGFAAADAELVVRRDTMEWERIPMEEGADSGVFTIRLFDLTDTTSYYIEAAGVRSSVYRLEVADLPSVARLDLEYRFPAYTGLTPDTVIGGGDIAAVGGTVVTVRVRTTMPVSGGQLVVEGEAPTPLTVDGDSTLSGRLTVRRPGFYRVELADAAGAMRPASLEYVIDVLEDRAPGVRFTTPGRDSKATSVEEVFVNAEATDDFGVSTLELRYAVNGGAEQRIVLHGPVARGPREITGGHTFFLEEMNLQPGDVISYYARATDGSRGGPAAGRATSDIYFIEIRPFDRTYRQAEAAGGQGGAGESPSVLSRQQREIVAATFRVVRDSASYSTAERREHLSTLVLSQGRLRERVEQLEMQIRMRGIMSADSAFRTIAEELPRAIEAMKDAEKELAASDARGALPAEQKALQHLQRAEAAYREVEVAFGNQPSGGGGQSEAEDLADLFELETDKLRNQYETVQRGSREEQQRELDELRERLRRLAERQQQENERLRRLAEASAQGSGGGSSGEAQRRMAQEAEELARQLERLSREQSAPELQESARRLREAAAEMRRSASTEGAQGLSGASSALGRLEEARRRLEQSRAAGVETGVQEALRRAEELAERQRELAADAERSARDATGSARLEQRKNALADDVSALEQRLAQLGREARGRQQETARALQEASGFVRQRRLDEKIRFSGRVARSGTPEYVRDFEQQLTADMDSLRARVAAAASAVGEDSGGRREAALDRARELVRGLESLERRSADRADAGSREAPGNAPGQRGAEGARAGQGERGTPESQSRRGEGGEGGGEGETSGGAQSGGGRSAQASPNQGTPGGSGQGGGAIDPRTARQFSREYREQRENAEALRRALAEEGLGVEELDRLIGRMRALESQRVYDDQEELRRLQSAVLDGFKAFEFALRRQLLGSEDGPRLDGTADIPPEFRRLVEEYYKALARGDRR